MHCPIVLEDNKGKGPRMKKTVAIIGTIALLSIATPAAISAVHNKSDESKPSVTSPSVIGAIQDDITSSDAPSATPPGVTPGIESPLGLSINSQENQYDEGEMNQDDEDDLDQDDEDDD